MSNQKETKPVSTVTSSPARMIAQSLGAAVIGGFVIMYWVNKSEPEPLPSPQYNDATEATLQAVKRINDMAAVFAEHRSGCAAGSDKTARYIATHKAVSSLLRHAFLKGVNSGQFANDLEHAMLKNVHIVEERLPEGVLAAYYSQPGEPKLLLMEESTIPVYGSVPRFFNELSEKDFNGNGNIMLLTSPGNGVFKTVHLSMTGTAQINGKEVKVPLVSPCIPANRATALNP